jgi:hypothetical protein
MPAPVRLESMKKRTFLLLLFSALVALALLGLLVRR